MTFDDIPSHIMREHGSNREHIQCRRYTLTYNEGTRAERRAAVGSAIYPHI